MGVPVAPGLFEGVGEFVVPALAVAVGDEERVGVAPRDAVAVGLRLLDGVPEGVLLTVVPPIFFVPLWEAVPLGVGVLEKVGAPPLAPSGAAAAMPTGSKGSTRMEVSATATAVDREKAAVDTFASRASAASVFVTTMTMRSPSITAPPSWRRGGGAPAPAAAATTPAGVARRRRTPDALQLP